MNDLGVKASYEALSKDVGERKELKLKLRLQLQGTTHMFSPEPLLPHQARFQQSASVVLIPQAGCSACPCH